MLLDFFTKTLLGRAARKQRAAAARHAAGRAKFENGSFAAALAELLEASTLDPGNADIHYAIAKCHRALGNQAAMHTAFRAALAANGDHLPTHIALSGIACPGPDYRERIAAIHELLRPKRYLEIGVAHGRTIVLARPDTVAVGVDPEPKIEQELGPNVRIVPLPSDEFFARIDLATIFDNGPLDLAFIDGMHNFDFALRDFIGVERLSTPGSTILIHDTYPLDGITADRDRTTVFWSGDTWRLVLALKKYRPDLSIHTIAAGPTGLTMVRNLDPGSPVLAGRLDAIVAEYLALDYSALERDKAAALNLIPNDWAQIRALLDRSPVQSA